MRSVVDKQVIVPVGASAAKFHGMITVNKTGAYLWELLEQEQTVFSLTEKLTQRYVVSEETARKDVERLLEALRSAGALIEE